VTYKSRVRDVHLSAIKLLRTVVYCNNHTTSKRYSRLYMLLPLEFEVSRWILQECAKVLTGRGRSSAVQTLGLWILIRRRKWMSCGTAFTLAYLCAGIVIRRCAVQAVLPNVQKSHSFKNEF
jgi:hypothetical protein